MAKGQTRITPTKARENIEQAYDGLMRDLRTTARRELERLDPEDPEALRLAVNVLLKANFDQKALAGVLGVSRPTISRWGNGLNLPRSGAFRRWAVTTLWVLLTATPETATYAHTRPALQ